MDQAAGCRRRGTPRGGRADADGSVYITGEAIESDNAFLTDHDAGREEMDQAAGHRRRSTLANGVAVSQADGSVYISGQHRRRTRRGSAHRNLTKRLSHQVRRFGRQEMDQAAGARQQGPGAGRCGDSGVISTSPPACQRTFSPSTTLRAQAVDKLLELGDFKNKGWPFRTSTTSTS